MTYGMRSHRFPFGGRDGEDDEEDGGGEALGRQQLRRCPRRHPFGPEDKEGRGVRLFGDESETDQYAGEARPQRSGGCAQGEKEEREAEEERVPSL